MTLRIHLLAPVFILALAGAACSGTSATASSNTPPPTAAPAPSAAASAPATTHDGRPIAIEVSDTMKFTVTEIRAKVGERLSVTLVNKGTMPKFSMGHNWVLLAAGVDPAAFVVSAAEAPTTDYIPGSKRAEILGATKLLGPNEQDTVTFAAPSKPGRYEFLCSFPGHFQVGMRGVLIVE